MTGILAGRADGVSCGASMVKTSVDFPREGARCQARTLSTPTDLLLGNVNTLSKAQRLLSRQRRGGVNSANFDNYLIGLVGFEPTASWSRTRRSTKLSHSPNWISRSKIPAAAPVTSRTLRQIARKSSQVGLNNVERRLYQASKSNKQAFATNAFTTWPSKILRCIFLSQSSAH
jgi:hypothetical protein